ncbi:hypothetical protein FUAX_03010 [Fulvitalea axinellae]|uniref:DUF885 domain-containing protein n=1 Tax=Fulvitalea axinellae TaxID=1182444 RepID=A0AAU9CNE7_9BACT|nr:hypothetical protein FUAX_03010 [Fulvitalea axinellae]
MFRIPKALLPAFCVLALSSCGKKGDGKAEASLKSETEDKKAVELFEASFQNRVDRDPNFQAYLGIKKDQDKWTDISAAFAKENHAIRLEDQKKANAIDRTKLSEDNALSLDLFLLETETAIKGNDFRLYSYPVNQMHGLQAEAPALLINMHRIADVADAKAYIARLNAVPNMVDQLIEGLKEREAAGIMPPKFVHDHVIRDCKNIITGKPFDKSSKESTLRTDFAEKINKAEAIAQAEKEALIKEADKALVESFKPAYEKLAAFVTEQKSRANTDDGVWKFPEGEKFYQYALEKITTTKLTAEEIHNIGLKEVERIHGEMTAIKDKVGFKGTLQEFFAFMRTDKQFYFADTKEGRAEYLQKATAIIDNMKGRLDELFLTKPKASLVTKKVEAFREKSAGKAFYEAPALDGSRPGTYYANLYRMEEMPSYQMEALAYHEGIPGHHMQISIAQELTGVPQFRKFGRYTAYIEGWALYTEFIPKEMGLYADPYSDFGRLAMELWRACRLVVDTGIHSKKWTREQGIAFYKENTPNAEGDCVKMVERHIVMPAQATAYKIGMLKIIELRKKAKTALGDKFDVREFHDVVLTKGPLPLNILEKQVDSWVASKKAKV